MIISPKTAFLTDSPDVFQLLRMVLPLRPRVKIFIWTKIISETVTIIITVWQADEEIIRRQAGMVPRRGERAEE
jgi:hypothetical protein